MRLYVDNHDVITAKNNGNSQKINLKEIMYVGTVYTDDTTSPDRYVIQLFVCIIFECGCTVIVRVSGLVGKSVEPIQHDN